MADIKLNQDYASKAAQSMFGSASPSAPEVDYEALREKRRKESEAQAAAASTPANSDPSGVYDSVMKASQTIGGMVAQPIENAVGGVYDTLTNKDKKAK